MPLKTHCRFSSADRASMCFVTSLPQSCALALHHASERAYASAMREGYMAYMRSGELADLELAMDRYYSDWADQRLSRRSGNMQLARKLLKMQVDISNLVTVFRFQKADVENIDVESYFLDGGDTVSVSSMAFYQAPDNATEADEPGLLQNPAVQSWGKQGLAAILVLVVALVLLKPLLRALAGGAPVAGSQAALMAGPGGNYAADVRTPLSYDDKVSVARQLADKNPERVAQIVRAWVQSDG